MNYKEILVDKLLLDPIVIKYVFSLSSGSMSLQSFHNKKRYCKKKNDLIGILQLAVAYEVYRGGYSK